MAEEESKEEQTQEKSEEKQEEEQIESADEAVEKELEAGDDRLPYPNARVVSLMKSAMDGDKMIRARVKKDMNDFLGKMTKNIASELNKSPYTVIEAGDLHRIIKKYEQFEEIARQKERMLVYLDRIKQDCNMMSGEIERSMGIEREGETKVVNKKEEQNEESTG